VRKLLVAVLALTLVAAPAYAATRTIKVGDDWFVRQGNGNATVNKGTKVVWRNTGDKHHNVTVRRGPVKFNSGVILPGRRYARKMTRKGTYRIICNIHRSQQTMTLRVR
jgi:plastocyanin